MVKTRRVKVTRVKYVTPSKKPKQQQHKNTATPQNNKQTNKQQQQRRKEERKKRRKAPHVAVKIPGRLQKAWAAVAGS